MPKKVPIICKNEKDAGTTCAHKGPVPTARRAMLLADEVIE
jgi:hypothetical protein